VLQHLVGGLQLPSSKEDLTREVDNIVDACNEIGILLAKDNRLPPLSAELIRAYNRQVRKSLPEPAGLAPPGELRTGSQVDPPGPARHRRRPAGGTGRGRRQPRPARQRDRLVRAQAIQMSPVTRTPPELKLTDDEARDFRAAVAEYGDREGMTFGFVGWVLGRSGA
jgi:hypothetical protein